MSLSRKVMSLSGGWYITLPNGTKVAEVKPKMLSLFSTGRGQAANGL